LVAKSITPPEKIRLNQGKSVKTCNKNMKASISCPVLPNMSDIDKEKYADDVEVKNNPFAVRTECTYNELRQINFFYDKAVKSTYSLVS
jgi:hypothetical protein